MAIMRRNEGRSPLFGSFFSDLFENENLPGMGVSRMNSPAVNVKETDKEFVLEVAAPGIPKEEIDVHVENNMLTISGEHKEEQNEENENYTRREFRQISFQRSFMLPENVNADDIKAKCNNGVINIRLPKVNHEKSKSKKQVKID